MTEQATFIRSLVDLANQLYPVAYQGSKDMYDIYWANGFNAGGAKALGTGHITEAGIDTDLNEITAMITLIENLKKFFENEAVNQADYKSTLNRIRPILLYNR
jgi:hypothetical protein